MLKKSILSMLMIFGIGFPLIGAQKSILNAEEVRVASIQDQMRHHIDLNNRDQYIKYIAILLPTAVLGATIWKTWKGNMSSDAGALAFLGGALANYFCAVMTQMLSNTQEQRNATNTKLREELTKIGTK